MIFKSFILGNPLSLYIKVINSPVVTGLYYGLTNILSIGPYYLFIIQVWFMEEEGTKERASAATTGFITGQLMMFISIYYAPLHLALDRPHIITFLVLPYLLFHFFWNNQKNLLNSGSTIINSMHNFSIQYVFLNNLLFQLFNHFILPSSTLYRLVNVNMFRCNNKIIFLISSFVGWLIGHILLMKLVVLTLLWIRQNNFIRYHKYLVSEFQNYGARIFSIILFITCVYYLGRMPSPIVTKKFKAKETEENNVGTIYEIEKIKQGFIEENKDLDKINEKGEIKVNVKETKDGFYFYEYYNLDNHKDSLKLVRLKEEKVRWIKNIENAFVTFFFDYTRWNRPLRYVKNDQLENALRNEMAQFFFFSCKSDGKKIISFAYPPSLSTFFEMTRQIIFLYSIKEDLYNLNSWIYTNEKKKLNLNNELINRIKILEKNGGSDMLEKKTILCDDPNIKKCWPKAYDPCFNGSYRGIRKKLHSYVSNNSYTNRKDLVEIFLINKIHNMLLINLFRTYYQYFLNSAEEKEINLEYHVKEKKMGKNQSIIIEEINKKVPRWSYKLTDDLAEEGENEEEFVQEDRGIYSRRAKRVIIYNANDQNEDQIEEVAFMHYSQQSDFRRNLIKGSMRAQRRKTPIWGLLQINVHSPLFLDRLDKTSLFSFFDIKEVKNFIIRNWICREQESELKIKNFANKNIKKEKESEQNELMSEIWDNLMFASTIRTLILIVQSFLRKYILLPSFIIIKNSFRILLLQYPEWHQDFKKWNREIHIKCTYDGVQLSETEFPQDWLTEGIQIKIIHPFYIKPWQKYKVQSHHRDQLKKKYKNKNFCFLTVFGMETELPFGSPRKQPSFWGPVYKELKKKILRVIPFLKKTKWIIKVVQIIKLMMEKMYKINPTLLFEMNKEKVYEPNVKINNGIICKSSVLIGPVNWLNYSLIESRMKTISDKTRKIKNQIEQIAKYKQKKEVVLIYDNKELKLKGQTIRLIRRLNYFLKYLIEKIYKLYIDILLCTINFFKKSVQLFLKSTKKILTKSIYNNQINREKEIMNFTFTNKNTIKKLFQNTDNKNENYTIGKNSYYISQAYVFYKLSQTQLFHKYNLRHILQYQKNSYLLNSKLKDYCTIHRIFQFNSIGNTISLHHMYVMNEWKNWLKGHYQYDLSEDRKYHRLVRLNTIHKRCMIKNKESIQFYRYKKKPFISSMENNDNAIISFSNQKVKWKKNYRYDLLSYKYIHYPHSYIYGLTLERNDGTLEIPYYLNTLLQPESFHVFVGIPISNDYANKGYIIDKNQNLNRKYFDCRFLKLWFINNMNNWTNSFIGHKYTKTKIDNLDDFYPIIYQKIKICNQNPNFLNYIGMDQNKLYDTISNLKPWVLPEFVPLMNIYKIKPWIIPIKSLFFNFYINENSKNTTKFPKKEDLQFENYKQEKDYKTSEIKKVIKQGNKKELELDSFLIRYFIFQFKWTNSLIMENIRVYCLLLRLMKIKEIAISSIRRGEINPEQMLIQKELVFSELIRRGIWIIEPIFLSIIRDGKFIIYQTIDIIQTSNKYIKKAYIDKKEGEKSIGACLKRKRNLNDFLIPEHLLSPVRRREFRIQTCFNSKDLDIMKKNPIFCNGKNIRNCWQFLNEDKRFHTNGTILLIKFKLFLWPNYRLEDLACMNRYWFNTNNSSRFSMLRIRMYSQL
uniref:Ycf1 n=1 Tax=Rhizanthella gardneri TaxID=112168 RepID=E7BKW3_RHIGD|nr:Ycf1 [Rhizanthella gardneri]ACU46587.1 Ycf1 [Rhizanthella gardneri]